MTTSQHRHDRDRQPAGLPVGGQFATSARPEVDLALTDQSRSDSVQDEQTSAADTLAAGVAPCPDCGSPLAGHIADGTFKPGVQCRVCHHMVEDLVVETDENDDEDRRTFEYRLDGDGTLRVTDSDGDTTMLARIDDEDWGGINPFEHLGVTRAGVLNAIEVHDLDEDLLDRACFESDYAVMAGPFQVLADRSVVPTGYLVQDHLTPAMIEEHFERHLSTRLDNLASRYSAGVPAEGADEADEDDLAVMRDTCDGAGLPAMIPVYESLADRGCLSSDDARNLDADQVVGDYETDVAPGVDAMENDVVLHFRDVAATAATDTVKRVDANLAAIAEAMPEHEEFASKARDDYEAAVSDAYDEHLSDMGSLTNADLVGFADDLDAIRARHMPAVMEEMGYNTDVADGQSPSSGDARDVRLYREFTRVESDLTAAAEMLRRSAAATD